MTIKIGVHLPYKLNVACNKLKNDVVIFYSC